MRSWCIIAAATVALNVGFSCIPSLDLPAAQPADRQEFAAAMARVQPDMTAAEVMALVGMPDDIRTGNDPGGINWADTHQVWRYGTNGHLTAATLGEICMTVDGRVKLVFGGTGTPPDRSMFEEEQLRQLLRLLAAVPGCYSGIGNYDPLAVVQAVNALQPLGKERALAAIDEHLRVYAGTDSDNTGVLYVLHALFEVPAGIGHMPLPGLGMPMSKLPEDLRQIPRYPIAIQDGIPFAITAAYTLLGAPPFPQTDVQYFRENGVLRSMPLAPTVRPLDAAIILTHSPQWDWGLAGGDSGDDQGVDLVLLGQVLNMLDSVYRVEQADAWSPLPADLSEASIDRIMTDIGALDIRWDTARNIYTFADGTTLPRQGPVVYYRQVWRPHVPGLDFLELSFERTSRRSVTAGLRFAYSPSSSFQPTTLTVYSVAAPDVPLYQMDRILPFDTYDGSGPGSGKMSFDMPLHEADSIIVKLTQGSWTASHNVYTP